MNVFEFRIKDLHSPVKMNSNLKENEDFNLNLSYICLSLLQTSFNRKFCFLTHLQNHCDSYTYKNTRSVV